jgi:hypothetical protein
MCFLFHPPSSSLRPLQVRHHILGEALAVLLHDALSNISHDIPQHLLQLERYAAQLDVDKMLLVNFPIHKSKPLEIHAFVKDCFEKIHP